ncbi:GNAT family N-acetyltransferase [Desulforhopalus sp. IMCC35007]|uniref:GNAT family N-acetyltransferase n=1 Tax=Desulforhopalus sp. IMCC35007 TaxID=2569543 RepID=UPI0010AE7983|nr:GNAT family N-acetyltransferase [Desulforhopalus sp. IMCC35007]TKB08347.1 GNAT family N-acetyltransferase [Desulforhopalus sp. IMCC35007]
MMIRPATPQDAEILTRISFASKGYWGYPESYFAIWTKELTVDASYIEKNDVMAFQQGGAVVGYYSVVTLESDLVFGETSLEKGVWLEHMFITPECIGKGIGTQLFSNLHAKCREREIPRLCILADPHARGFYEKMGCEYKREYPSSIKNRTTPLLVLMV